MYEGLIQRLENAAGGPEGIKMAHEAADAIAALQVENAELKQRLDKVNDFEKSKCAKLLEKLSRVEAERDAVKRTLDGICSQIDNDCWLRKQFCENGDSDLEPCLCPSLREHSGYIDSDDCEGCDFFVNSWCGAQGEA